MPRLVGRRPWACRSRCRRHKAASGGPRRCSASTTTRSSGRSPKERAEGPIDSRRRGNRAERRARARRRTGTGWQEPHRRVDLRGVPRRGAARPAKAVLLSPVQQRRWHGSTCRHDSVDQRGGKRGRADIDRRCSGRPGWDRAQPAALLVSADRPLFGGGHRRRRRQLRLQGSGPVTVAASLLVIAPLVLVGNAVTVGVAVVAIGDAVVVAVAQTTRRRHGRRYRHRHVAGLGHHPWGR